MSEQGPEQAGWVVCGPDGEVVDSGPPTVLTAETTMGEEN